MKTPEQNADLTMLKSKKSQQTLKHLLSPLEKAALMHDYGPFRYNMDGARIYIPAAACKRLVGLITQKAELLNWAIKNDEIAKAVPYKQREAFDDPRIILSLHYSIRNRLCRLECYTLFRIMKHGRQYFIDQKFGKRAMKTLDCLFEKQQCKRLFK